MKKQTRPNVKKTESANPLMNAAVVAAVALAVLPAAIFGAVRYYQFQTAASAKAVEVEVSKPKRSSIAERRAQRLEARKAKEAKAKNFYPEITLETVEPYDYDDFGMGYEADMDYDGFDMMPPAYMGGPGMMPQAYMGGPGMMPPVYLLGGPGMMPVGRGNFNEFRRMPDADMGFNNGFGGGRGSF